MEEFPWYASDVTPDAKERRRLEKNRKARERYAEKKAKIKRDAFPVVQLDTKDIIKQIAKVQTQLGSQSGDWDVYKSWTDRKAGAGNSSAPASGSTGHHTDTLANYRSNCSCSACRAITSQGAGTSSRLDPWTLRQCEKSLSLPAIWRWTFYDGSSIEISDQVIRSFSGPAESLWKEAWNEAKKMPQQPGVYVTPSVYPSSKPLPIYPAMNYAINIVKPDLLPPTRTLPKSTQDDPILAVKRVFLRREGASMGSFADGQGRLNIYPLSTDTGTPSPVGLVRAACKNKAPDSAHEPPSIDCECGWHATKLTHMYTNAGIGTWSETSAQVRVLLYVELFGKIIECQEGYRAEYQRPLRLDFSERDAIVVEKFVCQKCSFNQVTANSWPVLDSATLMSAPSFGTYDFGAYSYNIVTKTGEVKTGVALDFDRSKKPSDLSAYSYKGVPCTHRPSLKTLGLLDAYTPQEIAREVGLPVIWSDGKQYL